MKIIIVFLLLIISNENSPAQDDSSIFFIYWDLTVKNGKVHLKWEVADEINTYGWEVLRKNFEVGWRVVQFLPSPDNVGFTVTYRYSDPVRKGRYWYQLRRIRRDGSLASSSTKEVAVGPLSFQLAQNYPNPVNQTTSIEFELDRPEIVTLRLYNILGQAISTLVSHQLYQDGTHLMSLAFQGMASGVYFLEITTVSGRRDRKKVILQK